MNKKYLSLLLLPLITIGCGESPISGFTKTHEMDFNQYDLGGNSKELTGEDRLNTGLVNYFNSSIEEGLLENIEVGSDYIGIKKYENLDEDPYKVLQISSGNYSGEVIFNFSKTLVNLRVTAQAYYKKFMYTDPDTLEKYPVYSVDLDTTFMIQEESWTLDGYDYDETSLIKPEPCIKEFSINSKSLTISDDDNLGRIMIHKLEFQFE